MPEDPVQNEDNNGKKEAAMRLLTTLLSTGKGVEAMGDLRVVLDNLLEPHEILEAIAMSEETILTNNNSNINNSLDEDDEPASAIFTETNAHELEMDMPSEETPEDVEEVEEEVVDDNEEEDIDEDTSRDTKYADRHYEGLLNAAGDYDCMEREFDVADPSYDVDEAREVLRKCRLLVLRNVFSEEQILGFKQRFSNYIGDIYTGKIKSKGRTSLGEGAFLVERGVGRYEIILPRDLADLDIFANENLLDILEPSDVLGEDMIVRSVGSNLAEKGANGQAWHSDDIYIFGEDSFEHMGVSGHDTPPFAVTMTTPLLPITYDHGPTEFCMGTSNLHGLGDRRKNVRDKSLFDEDGELENVLGWLDVNVCPPEFWRSPLARMGDVVLFDFSILHRGGPNSSNDLRSMLFAIYSRKWYRDSNFDKEHLGMDHIDGVDPEFEDLFFETTRFAVTEQQPECSVRPCRASRPGVAGGAAPTLEAITNLLPQDKNDEVIYFEQQTFWLTNIDLVDGVEVTVDNNLVPTLELGESREFVLPVGTSIVLRSNLDGSTFRAWNVRPDQTQVVVSSAMIAMK
ncbi:hypothetical protein ACA910_007345 [Epithemia clementina (nom. ined.)]